MYVCVCGFALGVRLDQKWLACMLKQLLEISAALSENVLVNCKAK